MNKRAFFVLLFVATNLSAQQNVEQPKSIINWDAATAATQTTPSGSAALPSAVSPKVQEAFDNYTVHALDQRKDAFDWQMKASKWIFGLVIMLVLAGVVFSAIQFTVGLRRREPATVDDLELSLQGLKVRSQFLGIVTLALSLAFFYLYLTTVYPIEEVGHTAQTTLKK